MYLDFPSNFLKTSRVEQLFYRIFYFWHNIQADKISAKNLDLSDEEVFQRAKNEVVWTIQKIFYEDWTFAMFEKTPDKLNINSKLRLIFTCFLIVLVLTN